MSTRIRLLVVGMVILLLTSGARADVFDQSRCEKVFSSTMTRVNNALKSQQLAVLTYDPKQLNFTAAPDPTWRTTLVQVTSPSGVQAQILPGSFEVVSFQRDFPPGEYVDYDTPPKPTWTQEQATSKAKEWVKVIMGRTPDNLGKSKAAYTPLLNLPKYHEGTWSIGWPRTDVQGHFFAQDVLNVTLSEKFGIIAFAYIFTSKYNEGQKILVSHDQAVEIGRPAAQKLLGSPLTADWSSGLKLLPAATATLWIVNPNHILQYKSIEDMASTTGDNTARLAWVVEYRAENAKNMGRYVDVWVDTETKEILGGDFRG